MNLAACLGQAIFQPKITLGIESYRTYALTGLRKCGDVKLTVDPVVPARERTVQTLNCSAASNAA